MHSVLLSAIWRILEVILTIYNLFLILESNPYLIFLKERWKESEWQINSKLQQ